MKKRTGILSVIGICVLVWILLTQPFAKEAAEELKDRKPTQGFQQVIYAWGDQQEAASEKIVDAGVAPVEGNLVGEHEVKGSNWSIPNIIRHILGVDK